MEKEAFRLVITSALRIGRINSGMTLEEVADRTGIPLSTLWRNERRPEDGGREPSASTFMALALVYRIDLEALTRQALGAADRRREAMKVQS